MPGISGIEVRRALEEIDKRLRYIFLTGHGSDADFKVGSGEAAFYLAKPLRVEELIEAIHLTVEDNDPNRGGES
jgi:FixJ family two-component response regulator